MNKEIILNINGEITLTIEKKLFEGSSSLYFTILVDNSVLDQELEFAINYGFKETYKLIKEYIHTNTERIFENYFILKIMKQNIKMYDLLTPYFPNEDDAQNKSSHVSVSKVLSLFNDNNQEERLKSQMMFLFKGVYLQIKEFREKENNIKADWEVVG